jgi:hypothetical protein
MFWKLKLKYGTPFDGDRASAFPAEEELRPHHAGQP